MSVQNGVLLIADITGYTAFLSQSELEHAADSLRSLLHLLIEHHKPPMVISRLEGDAVFSYTQPGGFLQGQTIVEMIETTYVAYRRALDLMILNTTCTCRACGNLSNLDLKFFVHYGTFMIQSLGAYSELIGSDVNRLHRLTKNSATEKTGIRAYVLYTQAAIEGLGIAEMAEAMVPHAERYEHLGEVTTYVQDMHPIWERERNRVHTVVQPEDALLSVEQDFLVETALMWDYVTKPEYKAILSNSESARADQRINGRIGPGTTYYCAHGKSMSRQIIVDWQPLAEYTFTSEPFMGMYVLTTTRLKPTEDGTRVSVLVSKPRGGSRFGRGVAAAILLAAAKPGVQKGIRNLYAQIEKDTADRPVVRPAAVRIPPQAIEDAVAQSLEVE